MSYTLTKLQAAKKSKRIHLYLDDTYALSLAIDVVLDNHLKVGQTFEHTQLMKLLTDSWQLELYHRALDYQTRRPHSRQELKQFLDRTINRWVVKRKRKSPVTLERDLAPSQVEAIGSQTVVDNPTGSYRSFLADSQEDLQDDATNKREELVSQIPLSQIIENVLKRLEEKGFINDLEFGQWWVRQRLQAKPRSRFAITQELRQKGLQNSMIHQVLLEWPADQETDMIKSLLTKAWRSIQNRAYPKLKAKQILVRRLGSRGFSYDQIRAQIDELLAQEYN